MKIIPISEVNLQSSIFNLQSAVFIYPTDTCYGIGCAISKPVGIEKVYQIKGRALSKPVSIMVKTHDELWKYGKHSILAEKIAHAFLPGDVTLLLKKTDQLPDFLNPGNSHIGLRIIDNAFCAELLEVVNEPIVTTSANEAGKRELYSASEIEEAFQEKEHLVDYFFNDGTLPKNPPSTIIKIDGENFSIIRQGRVTMKMIQESIDLSS